MSRHRSIVPWGAAVCALLGLPPVQAADTTSPVRLSRAEAVEWALAHNPALTVAAEQVEQARARVAEARALPSPTLVSNLDAQDGLFRFGSAQSNDLGLGLAIPFPTKLHLGGEVARSEVRVAELNLAQLRQQTASQTVEAYDALLVAGRHREDLLQSRQLSADFVAKTEARFQGGTVPRLDVVKARVDLAQAENALIASERAIATARATLNRLLGREPGAPFEASDPLDVPPPLPTLDALVPLARSQRPEARSAAEQRAGARLSTKLAGQYWLPDVGVNLLRNHTTGAPTTYATDFTATLPLFFWQQRKGVVAEAQHRELELSAAERDALAQVELDVRTAYATADTAQRQALYIRDELLPEAQEVFRIASVSYGLGGSSALELLDAKRTLLDAQEQLADVLAAANDARADLERSVGAPLPPATLGETSNAR